MSFRQAGGNQITSAKYPKAAGISRIRRPFANFSFRLQIKQLQT
jgi:hypothetical protein